MTTTNDWIRMSERRPTEADLPVWLVDPLCDGRGGNRAMPVQIWMTTLPSLGTFTHWRSAKADIPAPPKEQTQCERDEAAYCAWYYSTTVSHRSDAREESWHAALAWERAEIAKIIAQYDPSYFGAHQHAMTDRLKARCTP